MLPQDGQDLLIKVLFGLFALSLFSMSRAQAELFLNLPF